LLEGDDFDVIEWWWWWWNHRGRGRHGSFFVWSIGVLCL
jgi:hypothetical protein